MLRADIIFGRDKHQQVLASGPSGTVAGSYTVARAMADYLADYCRRGGKAPTAGPELVKALPRDQCGMYRHAATGEQRFAAYGISAFDIRKNIYRN